MPYPNKPNITRGTTATPVGVTNWNLFVTNINLMGSDLNTRFTYRLLPYGKIRTFTAGITQPSVSVGNEFRTSNTATTILKYFKNAVTGQVIAISFADSKTWVQSSTAQIRLQGGLDFKASLYDALTLRYERSGIWVEKSRSLNT